MVRFLLSALCIAVLAAACLKSEERGCPYMPNNIVAPPAEQQALATFLDTNKIEATKHPSGFYYKIVNPGSGSDSMSLCTEIQINYEGRFTNDTIFDKQSGVYFVLGQLIEGWRKSIPLIGKGGEMKLYIPPSLGYGSQAQTDRQGKVLIPANSTLVFDVKLLDYKLYN